MATRQANRSKSKPDGRSSRSQTSAMGRALEAAFDGYGHDVWGLVCIGGGILAAFAIYGDLAGPVGVWLDTAIGAAVGLLKLVVPPVLVLLGVLLVRGPGEEEESQVGLMVGSSLLLLAACGALHLARGGSEWTLDSEVLGDAGGILGAVTAVPLLVLVDRAGQRCSSWCSASSG